MKKLLCLLLAFAMVFVMAACASSGVNDSNEPHKATKPHQSDEGGEENTSPTTDNNDATEPPEGYQWVTKSVDAPTFDTCEVKELVVTQYDGKDVTGKVVVSPLKLEDFDLEKTKQELAKLDLFKGWTLGIEEFERGCVTLYSDVGQQTAYEWEKSIVGTKEYYDTQAYFSDLNVQYSGETQNTIGYTDIRVEIAIPEENVTQEIQDQVYEALKATYGDVYATILCYAPCQNGNLLFEIEQTNATIAFRRNVSEYGLTFILNVDTYTRGTFDGYSGPGDYTPIVSTPEYFFDVFSESIGSFNMDKYQEAGAEMLKKHYADYTFTVPGYTSGYTYRVLTGDNGHKYIDFGFDGMTGTAEVGKLVLPHFEVELDVSSKDGVVTSVSGKFDCGVGITGNRGDAEAVEQDMLARAIKMMEMAIDGDQKLSAAFIAIEDGEDNRVIKTLDVLDLEKDVVFSFTFGETAADTFVGYMTVDF